MTAALRARLAATPLWDFALALYARPGVEAACLRLQDEAGVDVCELLWHCWLYRHGLVVEGEPEALESIRAWQRDVTVVVRGLRRELKTDAQHHPGVAEVRRQLQRSELAAERETLARLQAVSESGQGICPLSSPPPGLESTLASRWQLQKKPQLLALQTLECQLDPPQGPR
ncbi:TIGR02444 family protein [Halomonas campisalis]|uniref:TIGR02444 family protein n=2 Tax=Billgrantia campisalis TaxID=74661 RepID=A0ABS9P456_9GAMM|nr:TIGR02444 family protein [Halomonas campisalis]